MAYTQHGVVKAEKLLAGYVAVLEDNLVLPQLVQHQSLDQFKGSLNDAYSIKVPGRLPARDYAFRNDRSQPLVFDTYSETKITVSLSGHAYSAIEVTDEQVDFDLLSPQSLVPVQGRAVAAELNHQSAALIEGAPYQVTIGAARYDLRRALLEARRVLNSFKVPNEQRIAVVGSNFEAELLNDKNIVLASQVGDAQAAAALHGATLGTLLGFRVVRDDTIDPDSAYVFIPSAFVLATAVPSVPASVGQGSSTSYAGFALRWLRDYDLSFLKDKSVVDTFYGTRVVKDHINFWDESKTPQQETVDGEFFLRGVKITLDGTSTGPAPTDPLAKETGISTDNLWHFDSDGDGVPDEMDSAPTDPAVQ